MLWPTVSRPIRLDIGHPFEAHDQIFFFFFSAGHLLCSSSWGALSDESISDCAHVHTFERWLGYWVVKWKGCGRNRSWYNSNKGSNLVFNDMSKDTFWLYQDRRYLGRDLNIRNRTVKRKSQRSTSTSRLQRVWDESRRSNIHNQPGNENEEGIKIQFCVITRLPVGQ
jgi:hypothetical protein